LAYSKRSCEPLGAVGVAACRRDLLGNRTAKADLFAVELKIRGLNSIFTNHSLRWDWFQPKKRAC
jgi:hypothetical protein